MYFKLWKSSLQWTVALIQKLWDIAWDMWEHQNKALHGGHPAQQQILHLVVDNQIWILYRGGPQHLPWDSLRFITQPLDIILGYSLRQNING